MTSLTEAQVNDLLDHALEASKNAYIPYSNYWVGAALMANDGTVYKGCNIESASYTPTTCAERVALTKAVSEGEREFQAIAVVTENGGAPCGVCRQFLYEFAPNLRVIIADKDKNIIFDDELTKLLPLGFGASFLNIENPA